MHRSPGAASRFFIPRLVWRIGLVLIVGPGLAAGGADSLRAEEGLRVGCAEVDITPPLGFPMAGYYHERLAAGTKDPLKAKAIYFAQGAKRAAVVVCDLTGIARDLTEAVRQKVQAKSGLPGEHLVLCATHSHTAPDYSKALYDFLGLAAGKTKPADLGPTATERAAYAGRLIDQITASVERAQQAAVPVAVLRGATRQETPVSFNRRFVMKDGSVKTWMNLRHPDVVRSAGPIDPEIGLVAFRSPDENRALGVLSSFALHLDTVGGLEWSGDYPYFIERAVRSALGEHVISVFGTGCCGDINHSDPNRTDRNKTDFIGGALGATLSASLDKLEPVVEPTLQVRSAVVRLPLAPVTAQDVQRALPLLEAARGGAKVDFFEHVTAYKNVILDQLKNPQPHAATGEQITWGLSRSWAGIGETLPVDVAAISLGRDVGIVFLPGEVFVELGLAIKQASPFKTTLVIELTNCVETAYIPTRAAYAGGSYEVINSFVQAGSGEMLVEAALGLLRDAATAAN